MISLLLNKRAGTGVSLEDPNVPLGKFTLLEVFGGGSRTWAGKSVNGETAKTISGVYSAVTTIAGSVAALPIRVVQFSADGKSRRQVFEHPLHTLLNVRSSDGIAAVNLKEAMMGQLLLRGTSVMDTPRDRSGDIEALHLLDPMHYDVMKRRVGRTGVEPRILLKPTQSGDEARVLMPDQAVRICGVGGDGITGWSVVKYARQTFGSALGQEEYGARFFDNDATPRGVLEHPESLSPEAKDSLRNHWNGLYGGSGNAHRVAVLEEGMAFKPVQMNAEDSQFIEGRKFTLRDVARWFNIQPHKIGDMADAKWANIDAQNLEYLQDTLMPWLVRIVQALAGQALTDDERVEDRLGFEFDFRHLLRGDVAARGEYFSKRFMSASITPNEIRAEEGDNPLPGGDELYVQQQFIPVSMVADFIASTIAAKGAAPDPDPDPDPDPARSRREKRTRTAREVRAFQNRLDLRESFLPDFLDRGERMVRGEIREVKKLVARHLDTEVVDQPGFSEAVEVYYREQFPAFATGVLEPGFRAYAGAVFPQAVEEAPEDVSGEPPTAEQLAAFSDGYTEAAVNGLAAGARRRLQSVSEREDPLAEVNAQLAQWAGEDEEVASRAERMARRHVNELNQATSAFVWTALAVAFLVARTVGDSCPYCVALDGTRVAPGAAFFEAGDEFLPEGADTALTFSSRVGHPPFHQGCDCVIRPEV